MHAIYAMSVTSWGKPSVLLHPPTSISITFYLGISIPPMVEVRTPTPSPPHEVSAPDNDFQQKPLPQDAAGLRLGRAGGVGVAADWSAGDGGRAQRVMVRYLLAQRKTLAMRDTPRHWVRHGDGAEELEGSRLFSYILRIPITAATVDVFLGNAIRSSQ
ncbi:hypothetical protein EYR40_008266 [Pleurotus pulmonarius]|nr:hypothetical protein EYR36_009087 [Pleurotus pulmonarius]KAF4597799.1 hypothetical protein EYR40_008266 [Pleurotus pulmonarius]